LYFLQLALWFLKNIIFSLQILNQAKLGIAELGKSSARIGLAPL